MTHLDGQTPADVDTEPVPSFFAAIFPEDAVGEVVLWTPEQTMWLPPGNTDAIRREAVRLATLSDVYFVVSAQDRAAAITEKQRRENAKAARNGTTARVTATGDTRGFTASAAGIGALWLDVDYISPAHTETRLPTADEALALLARFPIEPSILVSTGHGFHAYWLLKEFWTFEDDQERREAQWLARRFQGTLLREAERCGWKLDNTSDLARLLRVPGTVNRKPGMQPEPVQIIEFHPERRYNPEDFEPFLADLDAEMFGGAHRSNDDEFRPVRVEPIMDSCAWLRHCRDDARTLPEPEWYGMLTITSRCVDGEELSHTLSEPYPQYSRAETDAKVERALSDTGPLKCATIREKFSAGRFCDTCEHLKEKASPITLAIPRLKLSASEVTRVAPLPARTAAGMAYEHQPFTLTLTRERTRWRVTVARGSGVLGMGVVNLADVKGRRELLRSLHGLEEGEATAIDRLCIDVAIVAEQDWEEHQQHVKHDRATAQEAATAQSAEAATAGRQARIGELDAVARPVLSDPSLLFRIGETVEACGVVGERANVLTLELAIVSQHTDAPISCVAKGDSSSGKSWQVQQVLGLHPDDAHIDLTSVSERGLIYDERDFRHRTVVFYEAHGQGNEFVNYLIRTLISEGQIRHLTVEKTPQGMVGREIVKAGPTNFITTTTMPELHAENETRLLTLLVNDSEDTTRRVLELQARRAAGELTPVDVGPWRRAHEWLALAGTRDAVVPFAAHLAEAMPRKPVRIRRDFPRLLQLVKVCALLHQLQRERDAHGRVIATLADYAMVREIVAEVFARTVQGLTEKTIELVEALRQVLDEKEQAAQGRLGGSTEPIRASYSDLVKATGHAKYHISRWLKPAIDVGIVDNANAGERGKVAALAMGQYELSEGSVLPSVADIASQGERVEWVSPLSGARQVAIGTAPDRAEQDNGHAGDDESIAVLQQRYIDTVFSAGDNPNAGVTPNEIGTVVGSEDVHGEERKQSADISPATVQHSSIDGRGCQHCAAALAEMMGDDLEHGYCQQHIYMAESGA